jgi:hypothetical protein
VFGGEPINIASGNMFYCATDYNTAGQNTLDFTRYYNSRGNALAELGADWRSIWFYSSSSVGVQRADVQTLSFTQTEPIGLPTAMSLTRSAIPARPGL